MMLADLYLQLSQTNIFYIDLPKEKDI